MQYLEPLLRDKRKLKRMKNDGGIPVVILKYDSSTIRY